MTVALLTAGSHGDVRPFVALALGLQSAGHDVVLAAPSETEPLATAYGVPFASLGVDFQALTESDDARAAMGGDLRAVLRMYRDTQDVTREMVRAAGEVALDADVTVSHSKALVAPSVAEATGRPAVLAALTPALVPTRAFPVPIANLPDRPWLNRSTYTAARLGMAGFAGIVNDWRRQRLGLGPLPRFADPFAASGAPLPVVHPFSPAVVPRPPDWPDHARQTGFWFLDGAGDFEPPADLTSFLDGGPPPVYVGFGSMSGRDPEATTRLVLKAVRIAGVRAILATGWGGLSPSPEASGGDVFALDRAPHDWLFPRCAAVVHHGGAGTTAAGLRAGRPTVICPFFGDQFFWGARVHALGAGPRAVPQKRLTPDRLGTAIVEATAVDRVRERAEAVGAAIRGEDGVTQAVALVERIAA